MHNGERQLSAEEKALLIQHETVLLSHAASYRELGAALKTIRDKALYRATHRGFARYCAERFGYKHAYCYGLIQASAVADTVCNCGQSPPVNEAQARELAKMPTPEAQVAIWQELLANNPVETLSAALIREVVTEALGPAPVCNPALQRLLPEHVGLPWRWDPLEQVGGASDGRWHFRAGYDAGFADCQPGDAVLVAPTVDLFSEAVPAQMRKHILDTLAQSPDVTFLLWSRKVSAFSSWGGPAHLCPGLRIGTNEEFLEFESIKTHTAYESVRWMWYTPEEPCDLPEHPWKRVLLGTGAVAATTFGDEECRMLRKAVRAALKYPETQLHLVKAWVSQLLAGH